MPHPSILCQLILILLNIRDQILNRTHLDTPLLPKRQTLIPPHHIAALKRRCPLHHLAIGDEFANHTNRLLPRQPAQIDRRLSMSPSNPHTPIPRLQRQHMSRPPKTGRLGTRIRKHATRERAIRRADTRRDAGIRGVDADGVGGLIRVRVVGDHLWEVQGCGARDGERGAQVAGAVADHEGGFGGGQGGRGDDEVAFVLARGGVEDDDEFVVGWECISLWSSCSMAVTGGCVPNACMTSGIESKAGCAGVGLDSPLAVPLTAGEPWSSATMLESFRVVGSMLGISATVLFFLKLESSRGYRAFRAGAKWSRAIDNA
jgi:hypothetical protein